MRRNDYMLIAEEYRTILEQMDATAAMPAGSMPSSTSNLGGSTAPASMGSLSVGLPSTTTSTAPGATAKTPTKELPDTLAKFFKVLQPKLSSGNIKIFNTIISQTIVDLKQQLKLPGLSDGEIKSIIASISTSIKGYNPKK